MGLPFFRDLVFWCDFVWICRARPIEMQSTVVIKTLTCFRVGRTNSLFSAHGFGTTPPRLVSTPFLCRLRKKFVILARLCVVPFEPLRTSVEVRAAYDTTG
jgi:hypothetical protein